MRQSRRMKDFPGGSMGKESTFNKLEAGDTGLIPGLGRFPGMATHSSILAWGNPMDGVPFPSPGVLPDLGVILMSTSLVGRLFTTKPPGSQVTSVLITSSPFSYQTNKST